MMKLNIISYLLILFLFFSACKSTEKQECEFDGMLYSSNGNMYFVPCDARDKVLTIIDDKGDIELRYKQTLVFYYMGEPVYAKLKGVLNEPTPKMFQNNDFYEAFFNVYQVQAIAKRTEAPADCCNCDYKGQTDDWEFEISEIDEIISFRDNKNRQSFLFDYTQPIESNGVLQYKAKEMQTRNEIIININSISLQSGADEKQFLVNIIFGSVEYNGFAATCF